MKKLVKIFQNFDKFLGYLRKHKETQINFQLFLITYNILNK